MSIDVPKKPVRIWADGCFDLMHYGHANALRQAKSLGDVLIIGVHSDEEIKKHKGPPVMNEAERYEAVRACKWVDEVVEAAPYITSLEWLQKYNIDYCVHGDDLVTDANGKDCYEEVKRAGRFWVVKRTSGVSTTDLVGRMLLMTNLHLPAEIRSQLTAGSSYSCSSQQNQEHPRKSQTSAVCQVLHHHLLYEASSLPMYPHITEKIKQFAANMRAPEPDDKIVYIAGAFDLFHVGHIEALKKAKEYGTYLIVGLYDDWVVHQQKGANHPLLNLSERILSLLQCKHVDDVIVGAPWQVTEELIKALNIAVVVRGSVGDEDTWFDEDLGKEGQAEKTEKQTQPDIATNDEVEERRDHQLSTEQPPQQSKSISKSQRKGHIDKNPTCEQNKSKQRVVPQVNQYEIPRKLGILYTFPSKSSLTTTSIIQRILIHRAKFLERNLKKLQKEQKEKEVEKLTATGPTSDPNEYAGKSVQMPISQSTNSSLSLAGHSINTFVEKTKPANSSASADPYEALATVDARNEKRWNDVHAPASNRINDNNRDSSQAPAEQVHLKPEATFH